MREWTSIEVFAHRVELPAWTDPARSDALGVTHLSAYSDSLSPLVRAFVAPRFTVARDGDFYRWRVDGYPLAKPTYVVLSEAGEPRAFAVLLTSGESAAITDFIAPDPTWRLPLFDAAFAAAAQAGATIATVETSCRVCSRELVESFAAACERFRNYYLIAPEVLGELPQEACPQGAWDERYVHETHVTGDVLLR
jgi:hypothetical protein